MNRTWIELDSAALKHNLEELSSEFGPNTGIMGVVKANGYGHGAAQIASKLSEFGVDHFCVAALSEGIELRKAGIGGTIIVLGYTAPAFIMDAYRYGITQTLVSLEYAKQLDEVFGEMIEATMPENKDAKLLANMAIDTGMHRIGVAKDDYDAMAQIYQLKHIQVTGMFTHLPVADTGEPQHVDFTKGQIEAFFKAKEELKKRGIDPGYCHCQNSFGSVNYSPLPEADYARFGILMYGAQQVYEDYSKRPLHLEPVMTLKAHIASVREIAPGETVGYGRTFTAERPTKIATVCIGYADGVPRNLSGGKLRAIVNGQYCQGAGRICMDQLMLDVTDIPDVKMGDVAILLGKDGDKALYAEDWARDAGTITNELYTRLSPRIENNGFVK